MKKILTALLAIVLAVGANAQIVSTTSSFETIIKEKKVRIKPKLEWYAKVGLNLMSTNWGDCPFIDLYNSASITGGNKVKAGFNVGGGFISHFRPANPSDFYWGAEVGVSQVGGGYDSLVSSGYLSNYSSQNGSMTRMSLYIGPGVGWMRSLTDKVKLDVHFNPELFLILGDNSTVHGVQEFYSWSYKDSSYYLAQQYNNYTREIDHNEIAHFALRGGIGVWYKKFNIDLSYRGVVKFSEDENGFNNFILSVGYAF